MALALLVLVPLSLRAFPNYSLDHITVTDGLPQSSVRAIAQDERGFLWVGTEAGLSRFDGYHFKDYSPPFGHGIVSEINVDSKGRLWISWFNQRLTMYDPGIDEWTLLDVQPRLNFKYAFLEDPDGVIWLSDGNYLSYFDETNHKSVKIADLPFDPKLDHWQYIVWDAGIIWVNAIGELVGFDVETEAVVTRLRHSSAGDRMLWKHNGTVWLCTQNGVSRLGTDGALQQVFADPDTVILSCAHDSDGLLWIGTADSGAIRVRADGSLEHFVHDPGDIRSIATNTVRKIRHDSEGHTWLMNNGVANLYAGGGFSHFAHSPDSAHGFLGGNAVANFFEDSSGVIWFGSEGAGLARISRYRSQFRHLEPPGEFGSHAREPAMATNGDLWIGMNQDGVYRFSRRLNSWAHFQADPDDATQLPTREVRAVLATSGGDIWASSKAGILSRYDADSGSWQRYPLQGSLDILGLLEHPDGKILIGRGQMLTSFDAESGVTLDYPLGGTAQVRAMALSGDGSVYVGTHGGPGVIEFLPGDGLGKEWSAEISDTNVFSLFEDRYGYLWVGTWGGGLNRLDPATGKTQVFTIDDGLPDNTIYGILPYGDDLWVSSGAGLAKIGNCVRSEWPCQPVVLNFDASNGLPMSEFDAEAHLLAPTGEMFFGGGEGLVYFHPDDIVPNPTAPLLQIVALTLNGQSVAPVDDHILLEHNFGALEITFSALDFHRPENNEYRYRLNESSAWISLGRNPNLILNNLRAGRYSVELEGSNSDGVWSELPLMLDARVLPPLYLRWPAIAAYFLAFAFLLVVFIRFRERNARAKRFVLESMVDERTQDLNRANMARDEFYANVSHEIRTPLTLLLNSIEQLATKEDSREEHKVASKIKRHAESLHQYVDSLITVSHLSSSPDTEWYAEDLLLYLRNLISDLAVVANKTSIEIVECHGDSFLVRSYPKALDAVFWNLLNNALRHTPDGGQIRISVRGGTDFLTVGISDTGPGIDVDEIDTIFDRGVRGRSDGSASIGFGIGLSLVKQTVAALGGKVNVGNNRDGGATFEVQLAAADKGLSLASYESNLDVEVLANSPSISEGVPAGERTGSAKPVVLIVEDHDEMRANICDLLSDDYDLLQASTAESAIELAQQSVPDIVICDVMLAEGNGFDVLSAIKTNVATDHMAVMMLTALADEASRMTGLQHRADGYLTKPFSNDTLKLTVRNLLHERRALMRYSAMKAWRENTAGPDMAESSKQSFESRFMAALEAHYEDPDCSIDDLARQVAVSRRQLERKTKLFFGQSPNTLLTDYRLDKAVQLLQNGYRIIDVSVRTGFGSHSHFGAIFKKRFGCSPTEYIDNPLH